MKNEFYMQLALNKAWEYQGLTYPNPAVGAVVTREGKYLPLKRIKKQVLHMRRYWHCFQRMNH